MTDKNSPTENVVVPGEQLGVVEEFLPQDNCFEEDGIVYSASWGEKVQNQKHNVSVKGKEVFSPSKGDIALAYVIEIRKQTASLHIAHFFNPKISAFEQKKYVYYGVIHVSNISDRYIRSMHDAVRPGDWIVCKVIQFDSPLPISLFGQDLGVIHASCFQCGHEVDRVLKRNLIRCTHCGTTQSRYLSRLFNKFDSNSIWNDIGKEKERRRESGYNRSRGPRRDSGRDRGRSGGRRDSRRRDSGQRRR
ncbi:MAG: exosome complex RNA-binding protein Csl4 [Candidatus Hodarchaeales archaeon]|jgi:exosome complex component CSL4